MSLITLENISLIRNTTLILDSINIQLPDKTVTAIIGPVESGKTMLLKTIGGILPPDKGRVLYNSESIYDIDLQHLNEVKSKTAFLFQAGAMLSNLTVMENLLLTLLFYHNGMSRELAKHSIMPYLEHYELSDTLYKRPAELSLTKKKTLSFIRTLLNDPENLLMDEPLSNVDIRNQHRIYEHLCNLKEQQKTMVLITFSDEIISKLAEYIVIIHKGKIIASDWKKNLSVHNNKEAMDILTYCTQGECNELQI